METKWQKLTPEEREKYVNQDYINQSYILIDVDTCNSEEYSLVSLYEDFNIPDIGLEDFRDKLTKKQLEVVRLLFIDGRTTRQTGEQLSIAQTSVYDRLKGVRKKLRKIYGTPNR